MIDLSYLYHAIAAVALQCAVIGYLGRIAALEGK